MGMKRWLTICAWLFCIAVSFSWAGEPSTFVISQASLQPPVIELYVEVLDQNGEPPARLSRSDVSANIQGQGLKVTDVKSFDASGEGVAYIFLVDISKSIQPLQFGEMLGAIDTWIDGLNNSDRMTIFTFGDGVRQLIDFTADKAKLKTALQGVGPTDLATKLYLALHNAEALNQRAEAGFPNRRVVVMLSDGKDEGSGYSDSDIQALVTRIHMPIYAIGSSRLPLSERERHLDELKRLAVLSGGIYTSGAPLTSTYDEVKRAIRRVFAVRLLCDGCQADAQDHPLELRLTTGNVVRKDMRPVSLIVIPPTPWWKDLISLKVSIPLSFGLALAIGIPIAIKVVRQSKPPKPPVVIGVQVEEKQKIIIPAKKGKLLRLTIVAGTERGRVYEVNVAGKATIGRDPTCEASFPEDREMSARHCELILNGARVEVADLGTTNGTLLNGARLVTQQRVEDGDLIRAGRTEFRVSFGES